MERMWRKGNPLALLVEMWTGAAIKGSFLKCSLVATVMNITAAVHSCSPGALSLPLGTEAQLCPLKPVCTKSGWVSIEVGVSAPFGLYFGVQATLLNFPPFLVPQPDQLRANDGLTGKLSYPWHHECFLQPLMGGQHRALWHADCPGSTAKGCPSSTPTGRGMASFPEVFHHTPNSKSDLSAT